MGASNSNKPKFLRRRQLEEMTGLSRSTIYAEMKEGRFPKQVQLTSKRSVGWLESEIVDYIQARIDASRNAVQEGV